MRRRDFLKIVAAGATAAAFPPGLSPVFADSPKPNIILILVDDLGWADVGCYGAEYGNDYYETPNIDAIRTEGMKFSDAYAACPVCSPTRVSVMTGRYPPRSGITNYIGGSNPTNKEYLCPANANHMPLEDVTIPEILGPAGYISAHVGKWHLGASDYYPQKQGFDYNKCGCHWGMPSGNSSGGGVYFSPYAFPAGTDYPGGTSLPDGPVGEYLTDREGQEAVTFIQNAHNSGKPFFLYLANYAVHRPIQARQSDIDYFNSKPKPADPRYHSLSPTFAAMLKGLDDAIGEIAAKLNDLNIADNTIIIFTGDNGAHDEDTVIYPLRGGKAELWEGGIREPFIVKWPGVVQPNSLSGEPVITVDLLPTICEMAGVRVPEGVTIDGKSIVPVLKQQGSLKRESLFWHYPHYNHDLPATMIRSGNWKLIKRYGGDKEFELFNLKDDISETTDMAANEPAKVRELNEKLVAWLRHTNAKMPVKNPNWTGTSSKKRRARIG